MTKSENIFKSIIRECERHAKRMNYAYQRIAPLIPLTSERISELDDHQIALVDQVIYRFSKLQDAIGQKLFKAVLTLLDEEVANKSAIDIFNRLEQLEIIKDYDRWKELRDLRNDLAHEYDEEETEAVEKLNMLFNKKADLENYLNNILNYIVKKGFPV